MNNNRQPNNNNRRRGRGNNNSNSNRPQSNNNNRNGFDYQNRIDNRARGNASQMLEKYKKLAADAQHNDDRVNAEYYLQFADHYFRVLADFKSRQEERRPQRDENRNDREEGDRQENDRSENDRDENSGGEESFDREGNFNRDDQNDAADNSQSEDNTRSDNNAREERPARQQERAPRKERTARPPRRHHSEEAADEAQSGNAEMSGLDLSVLPPSISIIADDFEEAAKPARKPRARRPKPEIDTELSTAAE
jgi:hypothetical protein